MEKRDQKIPLISGMGYTARNGYEYSTIAEVIRINKELESNPVYRKMMAERARAGRADKITKEEWDLANGIKSKDVKKERGYNFYISPAHKSALKSANVRKIPFDLTGDQVEDLLKEPCHFCKGSSENVITLGQRFDIDSCVGVCSVCRVLYKKMGDGFVLWLKRVVDYRRSSNL